MMITVIIMSMFAYDISNVINWQAAQVPVFM